MPRLHESGPFQGPYRQPRETTKHLLGPIWATFRPTKFKFSLRSSTILNFSADRLNCAKFPSLKCTHISLWLNPTGHCKFHNTSNYPPPDTDSGRTGRTPLYPPMQAVPPYPLFFPCPNRRRPVVPVPVTGVRYNSLLWMCTLNTLTWPGFKLKRLQDIAH